MFSKTQRFAGGKNVTPGPGDYDVKRLENVPAPAFPKEQRFSDSSDAECSGANQTSLGRTNSTEFKIPSVKHSQGLKKKSRRKTMAVQTDESQISTAPAHADQEQIIKELNELTFSLQSKLDLTEKSSGEEELRLQFRVKCLEAQLEEEVKDKDEKCEQLAEKLSKMEQELSTVEGKALDTVKTFNDTIQRLETNITELTASLDKQTQLTSSSQATLAERDDTIAALQSSLTQLQQEASELQLQQVSCTEQLQQQVFEASTSLTALTTEIGELKLTNEKSCMEIEQLQKDKMAAEEKMLQLEMSVREKVVEIGSLQEKVGDMGRLRQAVQEKEVKVDELQAINEQLSAKLDDKRELEQQLAALDTRVVEVERENAHLVEQVNEQKCCNETLNTQRHEKVASLQAELSLLQTQMGLKEVKVEELQAINEQLSAKLDDKKGLEQRLSDLDTRVVEVERENAHLVEQVKEQKCCNETLNTQHHEKVASLQAELSLLHTQMGLKEAETRELMSNLQAECDETKMERGKVQQLYDELVAKVAPFKQQLDAFSMERKALEDQSQSWASEAAKVTEQYAKLLGHQNQKQKIKRINLLSAENLTLKQDLLNSRNSEAKLKRQVGQLQERVREVEGRKKGNGGQKENEQGDKSRSPLKNLPSANLGRNEVTNH